MEKKTVHVNEWKGRDEDDGLGDDTPVLTRKRALEIARKEKTQGFKIVGTEAFIKQFFGGSSY